MKNLTLIILFTFSIGHIFSQNSEGYYEITFQLEQIHTAGDAKYKINEMREATKEIIFYFNDETDTFTLKTKHHYTTIEFIKILKLNNFYPIER
jgi:hypothetical protein